MLWLKVTGRRNHKIHTLFRIKYFNKNTIT